MKKIVTLSFDDGEIQDIRLAELLRKYGLQATFYLCSAHIGLKAVLPSGRPGGKSGGERHQTDLRGV